MRKWELSAPGRQNLKLVDAPVPPLGERDVLVRVRAVSLNFRDKLAVESGRGVTPGVAFTPASDMVGEVVATGDAVERFAVGQRAVAAFKAGWKDGPPPAPRPGHNYSLGGSLPGVLSEFVAFPEDWFVTPPVSLTDVEASTLPCAALTAWAALFQHGGLRPGQTIVTQGTGGVSLFALQFAAAAGANVIITSGDESKLSRAKALGAHHGVNRRETPEWQRTVMELTSGRGADHVLELVGGSNLSRSLDALAPDGRVSMIGVLDGAEASFRAPSLFQVCGTIQGIFVSHRNALEEMIRAIDRLTLKPVIDHEYDFADVHAALDHLERGAFGKIVVRVNRD